MSKLHVVARNREHTGLDGQYVVSPSILCDFGETTITFFDSPNVSTATSDQLRITIWAQKAQPLRAIIAVIAFDVIKYGLKGFSIPDKRVRVKEALWVVATYGQRRILFSPPPEVVSQHCAARHDFTRVTKNLT